MTREYKKEREGETEGERVCEREVRTCEDSSSNYTFKEASLQSHREIR